MSLELAKNKRVPFSELTEDNWGQLLDIGDLSNPEEYITESISAMKSGLNSGNTNVILRTIELIDFLAENCGAMMKSEISKKSFVNDNLVRLVQDSHTHYKVRYAIIKEIYKLSESFKRDRSLRIMQDTFNDLKRSYQYMCQQAVNEVDNDIEHEELRKDIEPSFEEFQETADHPPQQSEPQQQAPSSNTTAVAPLPPPDLVSSPIGSQSLTRVSTPPPIENTSSPDTVRDLCDFNLESAGEDTQSIKKDNIITIVETVRAECLRVSLQGELGITPVNNVQKLLPTTDKQLQELIITLKKIDIEIPLSQLRGLMKNQGTTGGSRRRSLCRLRRLHKLRRKDCKVLLHSMEPVLEQVRACLGWCEILVQFWNLINFLIMLCA
ncbi:unnamed protein product [Ambrosiozyma monospora]|uniref:Unnamed protein product n=1 Tax=Ambrosiozyma monospora TaxID=43982 RepID=A0A9W6YX79_AMBMO|nr:unnamed protein product [Ambrosiozyma monospora]